MPCSEVGSMENSTIKLPRSELFLKDDMLRLVRSLSRSRETNRTSDPPNHPRSQSTEPAQSFPP
jgi:hypothetical protein